jgi:hypothetical protein
MRHYAIIRDLFRDSLERETVEYWAHVAEIIASIGVIASIIYLAVEINDGTTTLKSQTHFNALQLVQRPIELLVADQELSEIVEIGELDPNSLTSTQWTRFCNYQLMAFNGWEYIWLLREDDAIPDALAGAADSYYIGLIQTKPGLRRFWAEYKFAWVDPFLGYVDEVMRKESGHIENDS